MNVIRKYRQLSPSFYRQYFEALRKHRNKAHRVWEVRCSAKYRLIDSLSGSDGRSGGRLAELGPSALQRNDHVRCRPVQRRDGIEFILSHVGGGEQGKPVYRCDPLSTNVCGGTDCAL
jgi:hypothetical protein